MKSVTQGWLAIGLSLAVTCSVAAQGLRARLGSEARSEMRVLGVDAAGNIRMMAGTADVGEVLVPLATASELSFVLPDAYQRAQRLAFNARPGEAAFLLRDLARALVPFVPTPGGNAGAVVRFYFELLLRSGDWDEAVAIGREVPLAGGGRSMVPGVVRLADALLELKRIDDAVAMAARVPVSPENREWRTLLRDFADNLLDNGHHAEAQVVLEKLRQAAGGEERDELDLLLAYADWHRGSTLGAAALVVRFADRVPVGREARALFRLLEGRVALANDDPQQALDTLGQALVGTSDANRWRLEMTAVTAQAYRAAGSEAVANSIESDLRRIYPQSRRAGAAPRSAADAR